MFAVSLVATPILLAAAPAVVVIKTEGTIPPATPEDEAVNSKDTLPTFVIIGHTDKIRLTGAEKLKLKFYGDGRFRFGFPLFGIGPFVFTPGRSPQRTMNTPQIASVLEGDELKNSPSVTLEAALLSELEFDLAGLGNSAPFKRFDQGVALRGVSALVLLDGVSVNDPFGGWVPWAALPREGLARTELVPGGGATAWGDGALGGVVQVLTLPAQGQMVSVSVPPADYDPSEPMPTKHVIRGTTQLTTTLGDFDTRSAELVSSQPTSNGVLQVLGRFFRTDGFPVIAAGQRGPIDSTAWNRNQWLEARWRQPLGADAELVATFRGYDENFGNGTPYQQGSSRGTFASLAAAGHHPTGIDWTALIFLQGGSSTSRFSAVNASRTTETPVIDQYAVPTNAFGANWTGSWHHEGNSQTHAGLEFRGVQGESRDHVDFAQGAFAHQLIAGGNQDCLGLFALHDHEFTKYLHATIGARIDAWHEGNGHRRETNLLSDAVLFDDRYSADHGLEFNPSLGIVWRPTDAWSWRANGQQSYRRPTLSEFYHSSGNDNVVIAANPGLQTEHNTSIDVSTEYSFYRTKTNRDNIQSPVLSLGAKAFVNELRDAIGDVAIARGTGEFPLLDTLPASRVSR